MGTKVALYVLLWAVGTAAVIALLEPPSGHPLEALPQTVLPAPAPVETASVHPPAGPSAGTMLERARRSAIAIVGTARSHALAYADLDRGLATVREAGRRLEQDPETALALVDRVLEVEPGPDLAARALWLRGQALGRQGDWRAALEAWAQLDGTPVDDYVEIHRAEALLELGRAGEAADRLSDLVERLEDTNHPTLHRARELRLQALYLAGRHAEFIARSDDFLDTYAEYPREDQLWFWRGRSELALGDPRAAARELDRVVWEYPYRPLAHGAWLALRTLASAGVDVPTHSVEERLERADDLRVNKHWDIVETELAALLRDVLATEGEGATANEIRWERWRNAYGAGDFEAALAHLESIREVGMDGLSDYDFLTQLADTYGRLGRYEQGVEALRERDAHRSSARRHAALADYYFDHGFFAESLAHAREITSERVQGHWDFSLLLFLAGEYEEAAAHFGELAAHAGGTSFRRYRYFEGRALQELGDYDGARAAFEDVRGSDDEGYYGLQAENRLLELDRSEPPRLFAQAEPYPTLPLVDDPLPPADETPSLPSLDDLASHGLQSLSLSLTELVRQRVEPAVPPVADGEPHRFERPARLHWDGPDGIADTRLALVASGHEITSAYWIPPDQDAFARLTADYGDLFPELLRADFLHDVGEAHAARVEARDASIEFRGLDRTFRSRRPTRARPIRLSNRRFAHYIDNRSYDTGFWGIHLGDYRYPVPDSGPERAALADRQIAIYDNWRDLRDELHDGLMTLGDYHFVRRFGQQRADWEDTPPDGGLREVWSEVYPRAYPELVTRWSDRYDLNPYIIWALMRVESSFNPDSISRANARGLLQVIPKTGELISERLDYWDFGPHNLMRPELSIEYGCYYFSELMTKFHGQELLAFAGYNGGPHNVARWLEGRGRAPLDAFIETIPFDQAREYAKKVYRFVALYRRIYLGEDHLYLGNVIDPEYENNIQF